MHVDLLVFRYWWKATSAGGGREYSSFPPKYVLIDVWSLASLSLWWTLDDHYHVLMRKRSILPLDRLLKSGGILIIFAGIFCFTVFGVIDCNLKWSLPKMKRLAPYLVAGGWRRVYLESECNSFLSHEKASRYIWWFKISNLRGTNPRSISKILCLICG